MRLLILARSSTAGGGARWTETFARGMIGRGHECAVIFTCLGDKEALFHKRLRDLLIERLCYRRLAPDYPADLASLIQAYAPAYLLVDNHERLSEVVQFASPLTTGRTKVVFMAHTQGTPLSLLRGLQQAGLLWRVVCVSRRSAAMLPEVSPVVIRNAVPPPPSEGLDVRSALGIPQDAFVVGYIGRHDPNKDAAQLYEAARETDWWVLLAGRDAPSVPEWGRGRMISHPHEVEAVGDWYRAMSVFVLASGEEGFPLAPMEALHCGTRVAMTPTSDYREVFGDAIAFFGRGDPEAMRNAIREAPDAHAGQAILAEELSVERMLDQYEALLTSPQA